MSDMEPEADIGELFDQLVGGGDDGLRYGQAERLGGLAIDDRRNFLLTAVREGLLAFRLSGFDRRSRLHVGIGRPDRARRKSSHHC